MSNELKFERKVLPNGQTNPKYIDLCDEDPVLPGSKFACMSFVSPDKILQKKELFYFQKFLHTWDFTKSMSKFYDFLNFLSYKYNIPLETLTADYQDYVKEEKTKLTKDSIEQDYATYMDKNEEELQAQFDKENEFQTSVRGLKIRGCFNTQEEAENHCKKLRTLDPNHDIYVGPVGVWIPWDPDAYKTGRIEFMEEELNKLHQEKIKNETQAKEEFEKRIRDTKRKAIEDNIKLAKKTQNTLTQTIDEEGNLVGVMQNVNFEEREAVEPTKKK